MGFGASPENKKSAEIFSRHSCVFEDLIIQYWYGNSFAVSIIKNEFAIYNFNFSVAAQDGIAVNNDHVLGLLLRELDSGEKKEISQIKSFLFACLLFEKNGRLLSKVKTPEDYHYTELKLATDENVARGDKLEDIYGHPHVIVVDDKIILSNHGKIEMTDGKFIFYDANGNRVPISILDY